MVNTPRTAIASRAASTIRCAARSATASASAWTANAFRRSRTRSAFRRWTTVHGIERTDQRCRRGEAGFEEWIAHRAVELTREHPDVLRQADTHHGMRDHRTR